MGENWIVWAYNIEYKHKKCRKTEATIRHIIKVLSL